MFSRIRRQLTILYTVLTALALGGFALLFYFGFTHLLMHEHEHEMEAYAVQASREVREMLKHGAKSREKGGREKQTDFPVETAYVLFAVRSDGTVISPPNQDSAVRPPTAVLVDAKVEKKPAVYTMDRGMEEKAGCLYHGPGNGRESAFFVDGYDDSGRRTVPGKFDRGQGFVCV